MLERAGWTLVRISGSHHIFTRPDHTPISIPVHRKKVKHVYLAQVRKIIEQDGSQGDRA
jgi:predicted RNA binding protein YcfA (HicA-like mRNA interferase family)